MDVYLTNQPKPTEDDNTSAIAAATNNARNNSNDNSSSNNNNQDVFVLDKLGDFGAKLRQA